MTALLARFRGIVAAPAAFTPLSLFSSGEQGAWYDPSDLSSMNTLSDQTGTTPAVGDPVGYIADKSGNGNHAIQATAAKRPTLGQTAGGLYYLDFDGVDDLLSTSSTGSPNTDKAQVFAGVQNNTTSIFGIIIEYGNTGAAGGLGVFLEDSANATTVNYSGPAQARFSNVTFNQDIVLTSLHDRAGTTGALSELSLRIDGALVSGAQSGSNSNSSGNFLSNPMYIGYRGNNSLPLLGRIYSMIVRFGATPSATTIDETEAYVAAKSGVTL